MGAGVVVTGAGRGIGAALATELASRGARLVVADLPGDALEAVAARLGAVSVPGDVSTDAGARRLVETALGHLGRVDVFFGNAGIAPMTPLESTSDDVWARTLDVNVMAHVRAARALLPAWEAAGGGRYVVTASAAGLLTNLGDPAYSVSKHGAVAFAEWLRATYAHRGVVVQAICPQGVRTAMLDAAGPLRDILTRDAEATPEEVARLAVDALAGDAFLVLPHPEVAAYERARTADHDRWLAAMNKLQRKLDAAGSSELPE